MQLYISYSTKYDGEAGLFDILNNDPEKLRRKNQALEAANRVIASFLLRVGGEHIDTIGASGHFTVPASDLSELEDIRVQFKNTLGDVRCAMGVGLELSESDRALKHCQKKGGDKIILYTQECNEKEPVQSPLLQLAKADPVQPQTPQSQPPENTHAAGGGFTGAMMPQAPGQSMEPAVEASEHSQGEAEQSLLDNAPPAMEGTHAAADFEEQFGQHADSSDDKEQAAKDDEAKANGTDDLKQEVLKVLQSVKQQAPLLQQLQATEPKLFDTIQATIQAMLMLAKRVVGTGDSNADQPVQKSEDPILMSDRFFKSTAFKGKDGRVIPTGSVHDADQLPPDFEIDQEGFVGMDDKFYNREQATEMAEPTDKFKKAEEESNQISNETVKAHLKEHGHNNDEWFNEISQDVDLHPKWEYKSIPVGSLSMVGKDAAKVEKISKVPAQDLPPIVVIPDRTSKTGISILDGNHRARAAIARGDTHIHGYAPAGLVKMEAPSVQGFMTGLKALPKGSPERGKHITSHMNNPGFLSALKVHPQGAQIHSMLTAHMNSVANAGFKPGMTQATVKAEEEMEKGSLPLPENNPKFRPPPQLVGAVKDHSPQGTRDVGKTKIAHKNGSTGWRSVRAGRVMGADGQPASSRNPGAGSDDV